MNIEQIKNYILSKKGVVEEQPFKIPAPVFKVGGKIFALFNVHEPNRQSINLKNFPSDNIILRQSFTEIQPGYHMNKEHWNTIYIDGSIPEDLLKELIDTSYDIIFNSLTKKKQKEILDS